MIRTAFSCQRLTFSRTYAIASGSRTMHSLKPINKAHCLPQIRFISLNFWSKTMPEPAASPSDPVQSNSSIVEDLVDAENPLIQIDELRYLEALGANFPSLNPLNAILQIFEEIHVASGLPWWQTIIVATATIRLTMLAFSYGLHYYYKNKDQLHSARSLVFTLDMVSMVAPIIGIWRLNSLKYPGLTSGGDYWFTDLTAIDPGLCIPLMATTILFISLIPNRRVIKESSMSQGITERKYLPKYWAMLAAIHLPIFGVASFMSAGANLSFVTSAAISPLFYLVAGEYNDQSKNKYMTREEEKKLIEERIKNMSSNLNQRKRSAIETLPPEVRKRLEEERKKLEAKKRLEEQKKTEKKSD